MGEGERFPGARTGRCGGNFGPAGGGGVLFEQVEGFDWTIFTNAVSNQNQAALALGCTVPEVSDRMGFVLDPQNGIPPISGGEPLWKENILQGKGLTYVNWPSPLMPLMMVDPLSPGV